MEKKRQDQRARATNHVLEAAVQASNARTLKTEHILPSAAGIVAYELHRDEIGGDAKVHSGRGQLHPEGMVRAALSDTTAAAFAKHEGCCKETVQAARAVRTEALLDNQKECFGEAVAMLQRKIAEVPEHRSDYKFPSILSSTMMDGATQSLWIPHDVEFAVKGVRLTSGTTHVVPLEVILRRAGWPRDGSIEPLEVPLVEPPVIFGRGTGETIHAAQQRNEWLTPGSGGLVSLVLFLSTWLLLDEDAASSNLRAVRCLEKAYEKSLNVLISLVMCCAHQVHLAAKPVVRWTEALSPLFATSKLMRMQDWKLQVMDSLGRIAHTTFQIVEGEPNERHREQNRIILKLTHLGDCRSGPSRPPRDERGAAKQRRDARRIGQGERPMDIVNFAWSAFLVIIHVCPGRTCKIRCGGRLRVVASLFGSAMKDILCGSAWEGPAENKWCDTNELLARRLLAREVHGVGTLAIVSALKGLRRAAEAEGLFGAITEEGDGKTVTRKRARFVCNFTEDEFLHMKGLAGHCELDVNACFMGWLLRDGGHVARWKPGRSDGSGVQDESDEGADEDEDGRAAGRKPR